MRVHPDAAREAVRAVRHYAKLDPRVGDRFERATLGVIDRIDEAPRQFPRQGLISFTGPSWSGPLGETTSTVEARSRLATRDHDRDLASIASDLYAMRTGPVR